jgi:hypothetical protein
MPKKVTPELMNYLEGRIEEVGYGEVSVELNESAGHIDVVTKHRKRFPIRSTVTMVKGVNREG